MKLLLDQGLPRSTVQHLNTTEIDVVHAGEIGMATAEDQEILDVASRENRVVITLDADFHALLAKSGATMPSVIRIRIEGLRGKGLADLLMDILAVCAEDLKSGAVVSVTESSIRVRRLPL